MKLLQILGAYASSISEQLHQLTLFGPCATGVYKMPAAYSVMLKQYLQIQLPVDAYRGAGRPEATYTIERLVEKAANRT